jgi:hypothetical protein
VVFENKPLVRESVEAQLEYKAAYHMTRLWKGGLRTTKKEKYAKEFGLSVNVDLVTVHMLC